jgi:AcrR family transcriptional regulator
LYFVRINLYQIITRIMKRQKQPAEMSPLPRGAHAIPPVAVAADQRRRLLEAVPRAVAENGYQRTTVDHIVKLAQVRRNAFYEQFEDKQDCVVAAYEIAQERLLGVLTFQCYARANAAERIEHALGAALELLAGDPVLARLLVIEAPAAGDRVSARHVYWLDRYGDMLQLAAIGSTEVTTPATGVEPAVIGAIGSRAKQLVLAGETRKLPGLRDELTAFALSFYGKLVPPGPSAAGAGSDGEEPPQPQSPEPPVLEPA